MEEKDNEIKVSIVEINEISYKQTQLPVPIEEIVFGENLIFSLAFNFDTSIEGEIFKHKTLIKFIIEGIEEPIIELETELVFHVINLKNVVKPIKKGIMDIDDNFLATLTGVSLGTSRGILAKNTKGTPLAKFPLPILNPSDILKDLEKVENK
jgi:hypothetical protein